MGKVRVTKVMAEAEFIQRTMDEGKVPPSYREPTAVSNIEPDQVKVQREGAKKVSLTA